MVRYSKAGVLAVVSVLAAFGCGDDDNEFNNTDDFNRPDSAVVIFDAPTVVARCFVRTNLVSDQEGVAARVDPDLVNSWGIAPMLGAFWIADNGTGRISVFDATGATIRAGQSAISLRAGITGVAVNTSEAMVIPSTTQPVGLLVASETGQLFAIERNVIATRGTEVVNLSSEAANFKGVAILNTPEGRVRVLATDFHNAKVDVFDERFQLITSPAFTDPAIPAGFAPFNVAVFGNEVFVTWAKQDAEAQDDVPGPGLGFVSKFDATGGLIWTLSSQLLNAPWGMTIPPAGTGMPASTLLVGNFGDGHITMIDAQRGTATAQLVDANGAVIVIDGLWGITLGDGVAQANPNSIFFVSGPDGEKHGLFGVLTPCP